MKEKLWCKIFGHDFRMRDIDKDGWIVISPSENCKNCGLSKKEVLKIEKEKIK